MTSLAKRPTTLQSIDTELRAIAATGDYDHVEAIKNAVLKTQKESEKPEDPIVLSHWLVNVFRDESTDAKGLAKAFAAGDINRTTYAQLSNEMQQIQQKNRQLAKENEEKSKSGLKDAFSLADAQINRVFGGDADSFIQDSTRQLYRSQALAQYWQAVSEFKKLNPKATYTEQLEFATKTANTLLDAFQGQFNFSEPAGQVIRQAPGVQGGQVAPIGVAPVAPKTYFKDAATFEQAIDEYNTRAKVTGPDSKS